MADLAIDCDNKCNMVMSMLQDAKMKLSLSGVAYENDQHMKLIYPRRQQMTERFLRRAARFLLHGLFEVKVVPKSSESNLGLRKKFRKEKWVKNR